MTEVCTSTISAASAASQPALTRIPLRECAPWCIDGDGHPAEHPEDRFCRAHPQTVALSLGNAHEKDGAWFLPSVDLHMIRQPHDHEPRFSLVHEELAPLGIRFTEKELRQLVGAGLLLIDKAEAARQG